MAKRAVQATKKDLENLPDEVRELIKPLVFTPEMLDAISVTLCGKRDEAKLGRTGSNIESTWTACEEAYIGIDDMNRAEFAGSKWQKPMSINGPVVATGIAQQKTESSKCTVFVRMTSRYVDAAAAKLAEILLPVDDKAFAINEMPEPDLIKAKDDKSQVVHDGMGMIPLTRPAKASELAQMAQNQAPGAPPSPIPGSPAAPGSASVIPFPQPPGAPNAAPAGAQPAQQPGQSLVPMGAAGAPQQPGQAMVPLTVADLAEEKIELAHKSAKAAEKRIYDWMIESQYAAQIRKVIFDSARLGVGVLKGPFPTTKRTIVVNKSGPGVSVAIVQKVKPSVKWVSPWDFFPDPSCGEDIHGGDFTFERDHMTKKQVQNLRKQPGYIKTQIDKCILKGPSKNVDVNNSNPADREKIKKESLYEVWYFYGTITRQEMACMYDMSDRVLTNEDVPADKEDVYAIITMVDDIVVRATINPLDSGSFPYYAMPWQRRAGSWSGVGVPEQLVTPQKIINGATRAMMDNAGIAAGPQVVIDMMTLEPADGRWGVYPNKLWYFKRGSAASPNGVKDAFATFQMPNTTEPLMQVVEYSLKLAEESTSIPLITEGQTGKTTPDTFGATQLQDTNSNQLLRSIGYSFDDFVTEPLVHQYYEWLLLDPDVPDDEKGEYQIEAHGSSALVERAIQDQTIAQMGAIVLNQAYGIDPKRWTKVMLKSKRIHPKDLMYTDEEQKQMAAMPPPPPPQVQAAQINAASKREEIAAKQDTAQRSAQNEAQIRNAANQLDSMHVQAEQQRTLTEATVGLHELETKRQIAMLEHANKRNISVNEVQADLLKEVMKLKTAMSMNTADHAHDMQKHKMTIENPPTQTPGKAQAGQAFEQG